MLSLILLFKIGNMLDNNLYNLMLQAVQESKSLWRINNLYCKDASQSELCETYWKKMAKDKESHIEELVDLIKKNLA